MLEEKIDALIAALGQNTDALLQIGGSVEPKETKSETAAQKKARIKREKKAAKNGTQAAEKITAADVKKQAKEIAIATDDPKDCMEQIRELVTEIAEDRFSDGSKSIDDFDGPALYLFEEKLKAFEYGAEPTESGDLEI